MRRIGFLIIRMRFSSWVYPESPKLAVVRESASAAIYVICTYTSSDMAASFFVRITEESLRSTAAERLLDFCRRGKTAYPISAMLRIRISVRRSQPFPHSLGIYGECDFGLRKIPYPALFPFKSIISIVIGIHEQLNDLRDVNVAFSR